MILKKLLRNQRQFTSKTRRTKHNTTQHLENVSIRVIIISWLKLLLLNLWLKPRKQTNRNSNIKITEYDIVLIATKNKIQQWDGRWDGGRKNIPKYTQIICAYGHLGIGKFVTTELP